MNRRFLLAAETFTYSFDKYADKLEIGAERFSQVMPEHIDNLEKAEQENWSLEQLSDMLDLDLEKTDFIRRKYSKAKAIIDAPSPAESFRRGVQQSIQHALDEGLDSDTDIEKLVMQICYRSADLSYLLKIRNEELSDYSKELREEPPGLDLYDFNTGG